jgi:hypothetical protein
MHTNKKRATKLVKVFTDKVENEPTFLVTYQTESNQESGKTEIIREKVNVVNVNSKHRFYGKTPIVFIRREHETDRDIVNLAFIIKKTLDNEFATRYERDIRLTIKAVLNGNYKQSSIKKSVFYEAYGEVTLKRPHVDFITFTPNIHRIANEEIGK